MENRKPIVIAIIVLILAVTAFFLAMLFKKQLAGTENPPGKTEQADQAALEEEKNKKETAERIARMKEGYADAAQGQIIEIGQDQESLEVKSEVYEDKKYTVLLNDQTEILKVVLRSAPTEEKRPGSAMKEEDEAVSGLTQLEKIMKDSLTVGMQIQIEAAEMLNFEKEDTFTAAKIIIF